VLNPAAGRRPASEKAEELRRLVTRLLDPDFTRKTLIVPQVTVTRNAMPGRVWHDAHANAANQRAFLPQTITFPDLYAWHIPDALVSQQCIVHDDRNIYCDSSILVSSASAQTVEQICRNFVSRFLGLPAAPIIDTYSGEQALVLHNEGGGTWGHYLVQIFPKVLIFCERYPDARVIVPDVYATGNSSFSQMFDLYGIPRSRLIGVDGQHSYRFGEVVLLDFPYSFDRGAAHPLALELLDRFDHTNPPDLTPRGAYAERLAHSDRAVVNRGEIADELALADIPAMTMGDRSVRAQAAMWHDHDLVVGTLGSDLTNIVFARPGSRVLVMSPDWFGDSFFYNLAMARGVGWHEIRCGRMGERKDPVRASSFHVDPEMLRRALAVLP
jgi:capsular polysaccharide biosynthesis protein